MASPIPLLPMKPSAQQPLPAPTLPPALGSPENPVVLPPLPKTPPALRASPIVLPPPLADLTPAIRRAKLSALLVTASYPPSADPNKSSAPSVGGAVVTEPGFAVISNHVIEDLTDVNNPVEPSSILYAMEDAQGRHTMARARVVGRSRMLDLALLQLEDQSAPPAELSPEPPQVGDQIFVIGAPWGLSWSATQGLVTGLHRDLIEPVCDCIQMNGGLNLGDSGGGAFDKLGRLSGLGEAVYDGKNSIGFVMPVDTVRRAIGRLHQGDLAPRDFGLQLSPIDMETGAQLHIRTLDGALVTGFIGPAATSGLQAYDRIVAVNGKAISTPAEVRVELELAPEGKPVVFVVDRADPTDPKGLRRTTKTISTIR